MAVGRAIRLFASCLVCILFVPQAMGYRLYMNMNQFPRGLHTRKKEWKRVFRKTDGLFGTGASNPMFPMTRRAQKQLISMFRNKHKVLISTFDNWVQGQVRHVNSARHANHRWRNKRRIKFHSDDVFIWSSSKFSTLTPSQLNLAKDRGFEKVFINVRGWGPHHQMAVRDQVFAAIRHPQCKAVVIEGSAPALTKPILKYNSRLQSARYTLNVAKKPVYFLMPPPRAGHGTGSHLSQLKAMLISLRRALGMKHMCSGMVTLVPAAYRVQESRLKFLPEAGANGRPANTYMGGALLLAHYKYATCGPEKRARIRRRSVAAGKRRARRRQKILAAKKRRIKAASSRQGRKNRRQQARRSKKLLRTRLRRQQRRKRIRQAIMRRKAARRRAQQRKRQAQKRKKMRGLLVHEVEGEMFSSLKSGTLYRNNTLAVWNLTAGLM